MLQPSTYPETYPRLSKTDHLQGQSNMLGRTGRFYKVPLTMFFENRQNHAGVTMHANTRTGHECTGLNDGSKNSVPTSYLTDAWNWGAEIFCGCEVRHVDKMADDTGYSVYFAWHGGGRSVFQEEFKHQLFWVRAVGLFFSRCLFFALKLTVRYVLEGILFLGSWSAGVHRDSPSVKEIWPLSISHAWEESVWKW